jgi:hypothetical protein
MPHGRSNREALKSANVLHRKRARKRARKRGAPPPLSTYTSSDAAKKNPTSIAAFSAESEPWMALRSIEVP